MGERRRRRFYVLRTEIWGWRAVSARRPAESGVHLTRAGAWLAGWTL